MRKRDVRQTRASFDYQWSQLPDAEYSPAFPTFRAEVLDYICGMARLERSWFPGKRVLDAGCGAGRFTFGFCALGADVVATDVSMPALHATCRVCADFHNLRGAVAADLLSPLPFREPFDLVWSHGVLHHTGDTRRAFGHISALVASGGSLMVMLYGAPRPDRFNDYQQLAAIETLRLRFEHMTFSEKIEALKATVPAQNLLEYFDTISPWINDRVQYSDLQAWFTEEGFVDLRRHFEGFDHYLVARRPPA